VALGRSSAVVRDAYTPGGTVASGAVEGGVVLLDYAPPAARHDVAVMLTRGLWQGVGAACCVARR
jgi:hypothetical protein